MGDMNGKVCLITGATSGIGRATATGLAERGARILLIARNEARGEAARQAICARCGRDDAVRVLIADLASLTAIRKVAHEVLESERRLDVFVHSAGVVPWERRESEDGIELAFAVAYLSCFLLVNLLLERLKESAPARIVIVTGDYQRQASLKGRLNPDDLNCVNDYSATRAGGQETLAKVLFTVELAHRLEGSGVTANCLHPGAVRTNLMRNAKWYVRALFALGRPFLRSPERAARTPIFLAADPKAALLNGQYVIDETLRDPNPEARDATMRAQLWEVSATMCGLA
ncbi:MAG: SDR family NAD(P)-dependent oxidoreductase [Rhodobacter sp.]|nr:SDR family NAD(P)-dependent oxidoreductase [Rhodobacter sp.]